MKAKDIVTEEVARQAGFGYEPSWEDFVIAGQKAGRKEAVEFMMGKKPVSHTYLDRHNRDKYWFEFNVDSDEWQAKLKEWEIS